jgi:hypothetical protein
MRMLKLLVVVSFLVSLADRLARRPTRTRYCWDRSSMNGFSKTDFRGVRVVYKFDKEVTEDAARRVFEYLDGRLKQR